jgi:hypothetical protein
LDLPLEGLSGSRLSRQEFTLNGIIFWGARQEKALVPGGQLRSIHIYRLIVPFGAFVRLAVVLSNIKNAIK